MIDIDDIRARWQQAERFLDERGRRLFAANEAMAQGYGGVTTTAAATGLARSTINRGIAELRSGHNDIGERVRRPGGGRKSAVAHQPGLPAALEALIEDAIRGDPCSPLRWVSRSLRHLVKALAARGFQASQRVVANLLRESHFPELPRLFGVTLWARPVAAAVAVAPPRPCAIASFAANSRRPRSSRNFSPWCQRERMSSTSITQVDWLPAPRRP